jgi:hypothetical protein
MKKSKCGEHMGKQKSQPTAMQLIGFVKSDLGKITSLRSVLSFFSQKSFRSNRFECRETKKAFQYGKLFVTSARFEPATATFVVWYSIQLSYEAIHLTLITSKFFAE